MEFGTGKRTPLWAVIFTICCIQQKVSSNEVISGKVTIIPPITTPVITSFNRAHNGQVCSTWGNFHFKTFDGDMFHFPGLCNYVLASHCNTPFEDFNIQMRRTVVGDTAVISYITMRLDGVDVQLEEDAVAVNGERVELPYSGAGFLIEKSTTYVMITVKLGLNLMWNEKDSLMLELDKKYANQTCGLCGDFNGIPTYNEFISNGVHLTDLQFGNMQKLNGPTEDCEDPLPIPLNNCTDVYDICRQVLTGSAFSQCNDVVWVDDYIDICIQDLCLCNESDNFSCLCQTFAEYSRQCDHAGGQPENWRTPELCPMGCPFNMEYQECGSPCMDTCTNSERSQLCEDHCMDGCFCPPGTVYDDISGSGCVPLEQCSCIYNGKSYAPGATFSEPCRSCLCAGGQWDCTDVPCIGTCSIEGGSHISTYDEKHYDVHGDCTYVLSKACDDNLFTILGELRRCGLTETETCLKMITLNINGGETNVVIKPDGDVFLNWIYTQLPISAANVTIFSPSSFFIIVQTTFGLQLVIQLTPMMQVYIYLDPSFKERTCGLCGNFDSREADDFQVLSGVVEGTAAAFANTWKTQAACPNIKHTFEDPCTLSIENEKYASHWCGLLTDSEGPFAECHSAVNAAPYHKNCMFDTCNCERSEDCMCAALSSYVRACAVKNVELPGWRTTVCSKYMTCPQSLNYSYDISSCQPTCRSLSEPDITCNVKFVPVDGCTCQSGTYLDSSGKCVPAQNCPCYYKGNPVLSGEVLHDLGAVCTCSKGKLNCIGGGGDKPICVAPMVYFDCKNTTAGTTGAECQKSCQTLDMHCYSTQCVSGCMCPSGLVSDGKGGCIPMEECPCVHNDVTYKPGEKIKVDCNTCVCKDRMWKCTKNKCLATCTVYGDGHYITFDGKSYIFNGKCEYTFVKDHCGQNNSSKETFQVIIETIPCGTTGTTCSNSIKIFLGTVELILSEEHHELIQRGEENLPLPYRIRYMGIYLVIETYNGLIILWDKKTTIFIKLTADFKGQVCGLCGNYDGSGINDFTTRSQSVVGNVLEFGNSWKVSPTCPDAKCTKDPCAKNPYRKSWSQKQCSIINSKTFATCHSHVDPTKYYEACVTDSCACDSGGDCECFCTAVAAYAQACSDFGICVTWRSPSICPLFCDYYNAEGECDWHYKPCGAPCMKTCRNPSGRCLHHLPGLEGCYPHCPPEKPYFSEDEMRCVSVCGCYDGQGDYYPPGTIFDSRKTCQTCQCTNKGIECTYDPKACYCYYEGKTYIYRDVIYNTTDGLGWCMIATCDINGTINREVYKCAGTIPTTPFTFTTVSATTSSETGIPSWPEVQYMGVSAS
nr:PREDICTED: mucin-5B-like [Anolis carolinensis]|eukprot:XP_016848971.1 PREDICTED: mucin-5B-like [Anolis carolinensis]